MRPLTLVLLILGFALPATPVSGQSITAHRGASHDAPENTLAAFELAWEQAADAIEADFHLTADSKLVCIHDADTQKVTGVKKVVAESSLAELRQLDASKFPTFAEVLATVPVGRQFYIELKTGPEIVPVLAEQLKLLQPDVGPLTVITFNVDTAAACKRALPEVRLHWLTDFTHENGESKPTADQIVAIVRQIGADGVGLKGDRIIVDRSFVNQMTSQGVNEFHFWTINAPDDARYFRDLGAVGITTDRPALIRNALQRKPVSNSIPSTDFPSIQTGRTPR